MNCLLCATIGIFYNNNNLVASLNGYVGDNIYYLLLSNIKICIFLFKIVDKNYFNIPIIIIFRDLFILNFS